MNPKISDMTESLQIKYAAFAARMAESGVPFALTRVLTNDLEQTALYAQGREPINDVNYKRALAGLYSIDESENKIVTWTLNSKHKPNAQGKSRAFDIVILVNGKYNWDLKVDVDKDGISDYLEAAFIGKNCGLDCGAFWDKSKDYPHYQEKEA